MNTTSCGRMLSAFAILAAARTATAQQQAPALPDSVGVLIVAHGADAGWNARVDSLAAQVRRGGIVRGPVGVSFLMGPAAAERRFQDQVAALSQAGAKRVIVVPALVSSFSGHYDQIRYLAGTLDSIDHEMEHHLHMAGLMRPSVKLPILVTPAMDDAPEIGRVLAARALALAPRPSGRAVMLFGHGPNSAEDYAQWMTRLRPIADSVRAAGFASVMVELVRDDAPAVVRAEAVKRTRELIALQRAATGQDVIVVPILVSSGGVSNAKFPADLAGLPISYTGDPLLPDAAMARWVERRVTQAVNSTMR